MSVNHDIIQKITEGLYPDPFSVLGMHPEGEGLIIIRSFLPWAEKAWVIQDATGQAVSMERRHDGGIFEAVFSAPDRFGYRIRTRRADGSISEFMDPYSFGRVLTDYDLHLIGEGSHYNTYEKMGAHVAEIGGISGVHFAVWAPNAKVVSVIGDFNDWDFRRHPMRRLGMSGIWEIFMPGIGQGEKYKFNISSSIRDFHAVKADPYGFFFEVRPKTASVVYDINNYTWRDKEWMDGRKSRNWFESAISVYEVHLGSWMRGPDDRFLTYRELSEKLIAYVLEMGYTHIELLPVCEHPLDASWGYQIIGYFAPTSRFGTPDDFMYFIDRCHQEGIGVILDWAPAHFPKDGHGLGYFDGTCLYEHMDVRKGEHKDWGTLIFNYGRNEVRNFLISNALFWFEKYHIDGLRVDAVASMLYLDYSRKHGEWVPNVYGGRENIEAIEFIKKFNEVTHQYFPGILNFAEESTAWPGVTRPVYLGGLGFDMKWNMGWMSDMLQYISKDPVFRKYHHNKITFSLLYAFSENFTLVLSHDEVVHGKRSMLNKMPGDLWRRFANLRLFYAYMFGHPGKKLLFMGDEFGQWDEWKFQHSLDWHLLENEQHAKLRHFVSVLNSVYKSEPALHEVDFSPEGFEWIDFYDTDNSIISFIRRAKDTDDYNVVVCNFTPVPKQNYRIGVPEEVFYQEILNSDSAGFWGSNMGNMGGVMADDLPWHNQPCSIGIVVPPLAAVFFKPVREGEGAPYLQKNASNRLK